MSNLLETERVIAVHSALTAVTEVRKAIEWAAGNDPILASALHDIEVAEQHLVYARAALMDTETQAVASVTPAPVTEF